MSDVFSVIVLLYNNSEYVFTCIDSVLMQEYPDIELIIVDDGSKEFDPAAIEAYIRENKRDNLRSFDVYQNIQNLGTVKSANGAIQRATGHYIKLLAADDALYDPNVLTNVVAALKEHSCNIVTGDVMKCDAQLQPVGKYRNHLAEKINDLDPQAVFKRLCVHNEIVAGGVFFTDSFFSEYGLFDESYRLLEDWPTWLSATRQGCRIHYSPFIAIRYRSNGGIGTSTNHAYMQDKRNVLKNIIIPAKKELGLSWYIKARISFAIINSQTIRKLYAIVFRR